MGETRRRGKGKRTLELREVIENVLFEVYPDTSMSSRQVFYQCLGPALSNSQAEYKRLCRTLVEMRRDGAIPYSRIVDRTRSMHRLAGWDSAVDIIEASADQFRRDMWQMHNSIPMIACEKQALEGILDRGLRRVRRRPLDHPRLQLRVVRLRVGRGDQAGEPDRQVRSHRLPGRP